ncbi:efflux transporter outer membrane subunit [Thermomonas sp.]|uniref:efflux transporter outer membrane subunit n=1 Tax=Thermomonas sp. TaxID=1971895 RepID=UPI0026275FD9|nr:efflux transporter outer membrane subunit [Thermomonas sp.]
MRRSLFLLTCGAALLSGCTSMGPLTFAQTPRDPATLSASRTLGNVALSPAAWPDERWWSTFGDPQLDALIDEALENSPTLAMADARARKAQAQAGVADAARLPSVGASAQINGIQLPEGLAGPKVGGKLNVADVLMLSLKFSPDLWGQSRNRWEAAVDNAHAAEIDARAARVTLAANIARTYIALSQAFDLQDTAQAELARSASALHLSEQRRQAGIDNGITVDSRRSAAAAAQQQAQLAGQRIDALRTALATLIGADPDRGLSITRPQLAQPRLAIPSELSSDLLARRADVVSARWRVEATQRGIDASKAAFYPSLNLSAIVGLVSGGLSDLFNSKALLLNGGPALSLPIFEGGLLRSQLRGSEADRDLAVATYNQTLLNAIREVADAVQAARALDDQIASATEARTAAASAHAQVQQRYRAGLATRLDVLSAEQPVLQLDQLLSSLRAQRRTASVDLDQALGGGIAPSAPDPTASK